MRMLWGQVVIETKLFLRDRQTVFWTFFFPLFLIVLFGFVFSKPGIIRFNLALLDEDNSQLSQQIIGELAKVKVLKLHPIISGDLNAEIESNRFNVGVYFPAGFGEKVREGQARLKIIYNPAQIQAYQVVNSILGEIVTRQSWRQLKRRPPIAVESEQIRAARSSVRYIDFLVPGLIGFSLMSTCLFSIGVVVVSYREKGKLRRLAVTPLPKSIFIAGQIITRYGIVLLQALILIGVSFILFHVRPVGNLLALWAALTIGMLAFIALGYAIASIANTPETASGIANMLFIPMTFLSGVYFSVDGIPGFLKPLVEFLPLTHLVRAIRQIFNYGASLSTLWLPITVLAVWLAVCFLFSVKKFRWE